MAIVKAKVKSKVFVPVACNGQCGAFGNVGAVVLGRRFLVLIYKILLQIGLVVLGR